MLVVAKCGSVFDHLVSSGKDVRQVLCNLYMKVRHVCVSNVVGIENGVTVLFRWEGL